MNYHNKKFRAIDNRDNGESSSSTIFPYLQEGRIIHGHYTGGETEKGFLLGKVEENGNIDMV